MSVLRGCAMVVPACRCVDLLFFCCCDVGLLFMCVCGVAVVLSCC